MKNKPYRKAVLALIINNENKFLIGSSPRDGGYKFPQGGINKGESSLECIKRELTEELGVTLNENDILHQYAQKVTYIYPNYKPYSKIYLGQEMDVFLIRHQPYYNWVPQDLEFKDLIWIASNELSQYDCLYRIEAYKKALSMVDFLNL